MSEGFIELGQADVMVTEGRGHTAEELAELCIGKLLHIGPEVPEPIRQQAFAYRDRMYKVVLHYMRQAQLSARTTHVNELIAAGAQDAAEHIRKGS